ncbi:MAG: glycosyltransferase family 4 protein [Bacteroidales bacterium]|jgi:glycosyltransferase involved in cell wall biosynthesis|nr:glycosyltransferase family 4 protein [Bacteroidales bacterium]
MSLKKIIITWVTTSEGGAEESIRTLSSNICRLYDIEVHLIIWSFQDSLDLTCFSTLNPLVKLFLCDNSDEYIECIRNSLAIDTKDSFMISNHRAFSIDIQEAKSKNVKCAIVFRGIVYPNKSIRIVSNNKLETVLMNEINWEQFNKADRIIGISNCSADSLKKISLSEKVCCIYNGVNESWFVEDEKNIKVQKEPKSFLICSRLVPWKNIHVGLDAFLNLANYYPDIILNIIGDGSEIELLQKKVEEENKKERVFFLGWQKNPIDWYRKSDCLIHPSPMEGFGRVIAEANANGLIAIAPQSGATGELIINHHTGLIFDEKVLNSCYEKLNEFMSYSYNQRLLMAQNAYIRAKTLFSAKRMATEYVGFANYYLGQN